MVRYIEPYDSTVDHQERLATILDGHEKVKEEAYEELDQLYWTILSQALRSTKGDDRERRWLVLRMVIGVREPLDVPGLAELMGSRDEETVHRALMPLQSVLRVSVDTRVVSTLHASFPDFLVSANRSKEFYLDMNEHNTYMAMRCFEIMKRSLKFNICSLETSSQLDKDITAVQVRVNRAISSGLFYASRYWGDHLYGAIPSRELWNMLDDFLENRLLFWMEVLNLKGWMGSGAAILLKGLTLLPEDESLNELRDKVQESWNFVTGYSASGASDSTPHIYISALAVASTDGFIGRRYLAQTKGLV
ncbi:hypothetical protein OPQ81_002151 [Rhizoctonia solani]|nr:hypothetical protein OPQ81_002151 [Rhizoctonia solani]